MSFACPSHAVCKDCDIVSSEEVADGRRDFLIEQHLLRRFRVVDTAEGEALCRAMFGIWYANDCRY